MSKTRDTNLPQHHYNQGHYGELPLSSLPSSTEASGSVFIWDGSAWYYGFIEAGGGVVSGSPVIYSDNPFTDQARMASGVNFLFGPESDSALSYIYMTEDYIEVTSGLGAPYLSITDLKHTLGSGNGVVVPILNSDPSGGNSEDGQIYYNNATHKFRGYVSGSWADLGTGGSGDDELVKVSSNDTTSNYLLNKLVAGTNITLTENNDGGNETITITAALSGGTVVVEEWDGSPSVNASEIKFHGLTVTDLGSGSVVVSGSSGGGAVDWNQDVNESGASFSNFTAGNGTWASTGSVIQQTSTATSHSRARYNTAFNLGIPVVYECDVRITAEAGSGDHNAGLLLGYNGTTGTGGLAVQINYNDQTIQVERAGLAVIGAPAQTISLNTWYNLRAYIGGPWVSIYVDDVLLANVALNDIRTGATADSGAFVGLITFSCTAEFRNINMWRLSTGLPA